MIRSRHSYKSSPNVIVCSDKRGQGPKAQLSPSKVQAWLRRGRGGSLQGWVTWPQSSHAALSLGPPSSAQAWLKRQISAASSLRAKAPDPVQLSLLKEAGVHDPDGPEAPQAALHQGPAQTVSLQRTAVIKSQRWGWGEGHSRLKAQARPVEGLARAGALQVTASSLFPRFPGHLPAGGWLQRESQDPPLTSLSAWGPPLRRPFSEKSANHHSLTVGVFGEGPTAAQTNGWARLLAAALNVLRSQSRNNPCLRAKGCKLPNLLKGHRFHSFSQPTTEHRGATSRGLTRAPSCKTWHSSNWHLGLSFPINLTRRLYWHCRLPTPPSFLFSVSGVQLACYMKSALLHGPCSLLR